MEGISDQASSRERTDSSNQGRVTPPCSNQSSSRRGLIIFHDRYNNHRRSTIHRPSYVSGNNRYLSSIYTEVQDDLRWSTVFYSHQPDWLKDNWYLLKHHRPQLRSIVLCLLSVLRLHSESMNIWTCLNGFFITLILSIYVIGFVSASSLDKGVFFFYLFCAMVCLLNAVLYHMFCCYSERVSNFLTRLKHVSYVLLLTASLVTWFYYMLFRHRMLQYIYLPTFTLLGVLLLATFLCKMDTFLAHPAFKVTLLALLVITVSITVGHLVWLEGYDVVYRDLCLQWWLIVVFMYMFGLLLHATRIPERFWPGKFDLFFHSRALLHINVILAIMVQFFSMSKLAYYQLSSHSSQ